MCTFYSLLISKGPRRSVIQWISIKTPKCGLAHQSVRRWQANKCANVTVLLFPAMWLQIYLHHERFILKPAWFTVMESQSKAVCILIRWSATEILPASVSGALCDHSCFSSEMNTCPKGKSVSMVLNAILRNQKLPGEIWTANMWQVQRKTALEREKGGVGEAEKGNWGQWKPILFRTRQVCIYETSEESQFYLYFKILHRLFPFASGKNLASSE
jgi:hypothetical protein